MVSESPEQVASALRAFLDEHFAEDVNLNLIAASLGYNPSHMTKVFQKHYGISPIKYLTGVRMARARYFLMYRSDLTVRQIGEMVGYDEQSYFSRMFKKTHGQSPVEFRGALPSDAGRQGEEL
jgi:AraC-like DNA-binding protein